MIQKKFSSNLSWESSETKSRTKLFLVSREPLLYLEFNKPNKQNVSEINLFKNWTFPSLKITVDTLNDVRNETPKHLFFQLKYTPNLAFWCKYSSPFLGHSRELSIANHSSQSTLLQLNVSPTLYQTDLRITNHRRQKFSPSLTLLSFETRIKWPLGNRASGASFISFCFIFHHMVQRICTVTKGSACRAPLGWPQPQVFRGYFFRLLQLSRQRPSFSAHKAAVMTKSDLTFPAISSRSEISKFNSAFAVRFHSARSNARVRFDSGVIFLYRFFATLSNQWDCFILYT